MHTIHVRATIKHLTDRSGVIYGISRHPDEEVFIDIPITDDVIKEIKNIIDNTKPINEALLNGESLLDIKDHVNIPISNSSCCENPPINKATYDCRGCPHYHEEHDMGATIPHCLRNVPCRGKTL